MKKTTLLTLFFFLFLSLNAQQFSSQFGNVISLVDYKNSNGEKYGNIFGSTNYHVEMGIKIPIRKTDFYFLSSVAYNKYGATGSDALKKSYFDFKVNYIGVNLGAGYEFLKTNSQKNTKNTNTEHGFTFYAQFAIAPEFLIQGTQTSSSSTTGTKVNSLKGVEQFDKPIFFVRGGAGAIYYASKTISVFVEYMGGRSFALIKSDSNDNEEMFFITHTISTGLSISLPLYKK